MRKAKFEGNLKDFSPWLSGFQKDRFKNHLEIPGKISICLQMKCCKMFGAVLTTEMSLPDVDTQYLNSKDFMPKSNT